jgi:hypothetical protein
LACTEPSAPQVLRLRVHTLPRCDLPSGLAHGNLELLALGDFEPSNESAEILRIDAPGLRLKFPVATQAVEAHVGRGSQAFAGYGERRENGLDVLLWPEQVTCEAWRPDGTHGYPGRNGGQALAYSAENGVVFAAGGNDPLVSDAIVGALSFDVRTGAIVALDTSDGGALTQPRAFATATPFGERFLVAGGEAPVFGVPDRDLEPAATAELFDVKTGRFSAESIALHNTRTHHAAVTLNDGRTLLVGGRSKVGQTSIAQYQLEIVDPASKRASVADAIAPRIDPHALRLTDGRIFVGGGVGLDGALTQPVGEWLTPVGRLDKTKLSPSVVPRFDRAFVGTVGGGVLAVGGCEDRPAHSTADADACAAECSHGCPPLGGEYDGWWITPDGVARPVSLQGIAAPRPILLPGSDGSPWLVAENLAEPGIPRLFRFNPWGARFAPAPVSDDVRLPKPGTPQPLVIDPDAFVWIDDSPAAGQLLGLRLGTRNRYTQDLALVLMSDAIETRPLHLVPDRPLGDSVSYDGKLRFSGSATVPAKRPDADLAIRVADTDYADVTVKLHLGEGPPPQVLLGPTPLGGLNCPWPEGNERGGSFDLPTVVRQAGLAQLLFHGGNRSCQVLTGRLELGLRAGDEASVVEQLDVQRTVEVTTEPRPTVF